MELNLFVAEMLISRSSINNAFRIEQIFIADFLSNANGLHRILCVRAKMIISILSYLEYIFFAPY